ncbi:glycosyltransferase [Candidatus Saccharibacteria bacterium]|nr:glycosyltransferase [Candidatus Saccharibacteria bacterium]MCB9821251.1 glycosyltransferase [Candidatus Nomurabacteria bacterium]
MKYSIIIPAYNEAKYIDQTLTCLADYLRDTKIIDNTEVIVVAANGGDGTASRAKSHSSIFNKLVVLELPSRVGKGRDLRHGFKHATGEYQLFMDADMATPLHHIEVALKTLEAGKDIVIGVRNLATMHNTILRKASSRLSNLAIRILAVRNARDTQCGFKAFTRVAAATIFSRAKINGWGTDIEILAIAQIHKLSIAQQSIADWHDPKSGEGLAGDSQLKAMRQTLKELYIIRRNINKGEYK